MNISDAGLDLIRKHEGLRLTSYQDSVGVWTVGYGHTQNVTKDMTITEDQANDLLNADVRLVEKCINNCVRVTLTQGQFDALCSFIFNLGCGSLRNSTLLRKLNEGDDDGAAEEFSKWNHAGGVVLGGLTARRNDERELFLT